MLSIIRADLQANMLRSGFRSFLAALLYNPGFFVIFVFRLGDLCTRVPIIGSLLRILLWRFNVVTSSCYLHPDAVLGPGLRLPHPTGIVIGQGAVVGRNVTIYQHVTIGTRSDLTFKYPIVEDDCVIYANAVVVGDITIGENSVVGASAVVVGSVPSNSLCVGNPATHRPKAARPK